MKWTEQQITWFLLRVRDMRHYQKEFFRSQDRGALQEAKRMERLVDRMLESFLKEPELFPCNTPETPPSRRSEA